jgi:hypothetical protein
MPPTLRRPAAIFLVLSAISGCAEDHLRPADAGSASDTPAVALDAPLIGCAHSLPDSTCVVVDAAHVCNDAGVSPECVDDAWQCPVGTTPSSECWCAALPPHDPRCVCTRTGWQCPNPPPPDAGDPRDAGVDAAPSCPADRSSALGTPCATEGASCGTCVNPCCGPCDEITCVGGTWQMLDLGCACAVPPTFPCGDPGLQCNRWSQYCACTGPAIDSEPVGCSCTPMPADCASD